MNEVPDGTGAAESPPIPERVPIEFAEIILAKLRARHQEPSQPTQRTVQDTTNIVNRRIERAVGEPIDDKQRVGLWRTQYYGFLQVQNYPAAIDKLNQILELQNTIAFGLMLINIYLKMHQYDKAYDAISKIITKHDNFTKKQAEQILWAFMESLRGTEDDLWGGHIKLVAKLMERFSPQFDYLVTILELRRGIQKEDAMTEFNAGRLEKGFDYTIRRGQEELINLQAHPRALLEAHKLVGVAYLKQAENKRTKYEDAQKEFGRGTLPRYQDIQFDLLDKAEKSTRQALEILGNLPTEEREPGDHFRLQYNLAKILQLRAAVKPGDRDLYIGACTAIQQLETLQQTEHNPTATGFINILYGEFFKDSWHEIPEREDLVTALEFNKKALETDSTDSQLLLSAGINSVEIISQLIMTGAFLEVNHELFELGKNIMKEVIEIFKMSSHKIIRWGIQKVMELGSAYNLPVVVPGLAGKDPTAISLT